MSGMPWITWAPPNSAMHTCYREDKRGFVYFVIERNKKKSVNRAWHGCTVVSGAGGLQGDADIAQVWPWNLGRAGTGQRHTAGPSALPSLMLSLLHFLNFLVMQEAGNLNLGNPSCSWVVGVAVLRLMPLLSPCRRVVTWPFRPLSPAFNFKVFTYILISYQFVKKVIRISSHSLWNKNKKIN